MSDDADRIDRELLEAWRAGDETAGNALLERHFATLLRFLRAGHTFVRAPMSAPKPLAPAPRSYQAPRASRPRTDDTCQIAVAAAIGSTSVETFVAPTIAASSVPRYELAARETCALTGTASSRTAPTSSPPTRTCMAHLRNTFRG